MKRISAGFIAYLFLIPALFLFSACDGGSDGGGSPTGPSADAPVVTNFSITPLTPERANRTVRYRITCTVTDRNGDLMGGRLEIVSGTTASLGIDSDVLQGNQIFAALELPPLPAGTYGADFIVYDAAGHGSTPITFILDIRSVSPVTGKSVGRGPISGMALLPAE